MPQEFKVKRPNGQSIRIESHVLWIYKNGLVQSGTPVSMITNLKRNLLNPSIHLQISSEASVITYLFETFQERDEFISKLIDVDSVDSYIAEKYAYSVYMKYLKLLDEIEAKISFNSDSLQ